MVTFLYKILPATGEVLVFSTLHFTHFSENLMEKRFNGL